MKKETYLDQLLKHHSMSKADFAELVQESPQTINNWRLRGIPAAKATKIAKAFNMSIDDVLTEKLADARKMTENNKISEPTSTYGAIDPLTAEIMAILEKKPTEELRRILQVIKAME